MKFLKNEDGTVTIDWVVITAVIAGLGVAIVLIVSQPAVELGDKIENSVDALTVQEY